MKKKDKKTMRKKRIFEENFKREFYENLIWEHPELLRVFSVTVFLIVFVLFIYSYFESQ